MNGDSTTAAREILLVTHTGRPDIQRRAADTIAELRRAGFGVRALRSEACGLGMTDVAPVEPAVAAHGVEAVLALGGDGTVLRAAALARPAGVPLLGVNLGQVGFLAETEVDDLPEAVARLSSGAYTVEERLCVDAVVETDGHVVSRLWALNEATVEKGEPSRMVEVLIEIDGRRLSRYGCDGVVCATPSGSTAHAMSAGGPVVWPEVEALLLVPISAHALFSRPLVVAPTSTISLTVEPYAAAAVLTCDGSRSVEIPPGSTVTVQKGERPLRMVRLTELPFTDRLVAKLALPVDGWRGHRFR